MKINNQKTLYCNFKYKPYKIYVYFNSTNKSLLKSYAIFFKHQFASSKTVALPTKNSLITLLKSPHVHKTARIQLGLSYHRRLVVIRETNEDIWSKLQNLLAHTLPASIMVKIKIH